MPITKDLNNRANIRQNTGADSVSSGGQPVVAKFEATSVAGQTTVPAAGSLPFIIELENKENFELFIDGKLLREGADADFTFGAVDASNASSRIDLNDALPADVNIIAIKRGLKKESELGTDNRFTQLYDMHASGFAPFVEKQMIDAPFTEIQNRAQLIDQAATGRPLLGIERITTTSFSVLQNEHGPNGEPVREPDNKDDRIRFVGPGWFQQSGTSSSYLRVPNSSTDNYLEVTFYGTGLNVLWLGAQNRDFRVTIDGGVESANILSGNQSIVLQNRNYKTNEPLTLASGLVEGWHTVKVRSVGSGALFVYGVEIVNERADLRISPVTSYGAGRKLISSANADLPFKPAAMTGTRGGRVVTYQDIDGSIKQAFTETDSAQGNLGGASHANETLLRRANFREFGANRGDDFTTLPTSGTTDRAFTLDDGTTTLVGNDVRQQAISGNDHLVLASVGSYVTITFVGTGLDIIREGDQGAGAGPTVLVDGASIGSLSSTTTVAPTREKVVSGLPYGAHSVRITTVSIAVGISNFLIYGPKKPELPEEALEIADYNVLADFSANTTTGLDTVSQGVVRKAMAAREATYINGSGGSFDYNITIPNPAGTTASPVGFRTETDRQNAQARFTFYGTGFDYRFFTDAGRSSSVGITLNGLAATAANFPGITSSIAGSGLSFDDSTGNMDTQGSDAEGAGIAISGLPLDHYEVVFNNNVSGGRLTMETIDVIAPIHVNDSSLKIGSLSLADVRNFDAVKKDKELLGPNLGEAKAWVKYNVNSSQLQGSHNIAAVIEASAGDYFFFFKRPMKDSNYNVTTAGLNSLGNVISEVQRADGFRIRLFNNAGGQSTIPFFSATIFGELADEGEE